MFISCNDSRYSTTKKKQLYANLALFLSFCFFAAFVLVNYFQTDTLRFFRTHRLATNSYYVDDLDQSSAPLTFEGVKENKKKGCYFHLKLKFRVSDTEGFPNLFQTSNVNDGIRAELANNAMGLVFPMPGDPSNIKGATLADHLEPGKWYDFEISAIDDDYILVRVGKRTVYDSWTSRPQFVANKFRVGIGFDDQRRFHGEIRDINLDIGVARSLNLTYFFLYLLKFVCLAGFFFLLLAGLNRVRFMASEPPVSKAPAFYDPLLTLRFTACLMVILGHAFMITFRPDNLVETIRSGSWLMTASPWGGVWIFFTLSGYLMGKGFFMERYHPNRAGVVHFYRNRLLRIVPLYLVSTLIVSALVYPEIFSPANWRSLFALAIFDYDGFREVQPIGALWSIATEMQFYMLVPLLFFVAGIRLQKWRTIVGILMGFLLFGLFFRAEVIRASQWNMWPREVFKTLIGNIDLFACGFMANHFVIRAVRGGVKLKFGLVFGFILLLLLFVSTAYVSAQGMILQASNWHSLLFMGWPTVVTLFTAVTIFCFELSVQTGKPGLGRRLAKKTEIMGLMTYAIYVWHEPIFVSIQRKHTGFITFSDSLTAFVIGCAVVVSVCLIMYYLVEVPFEGKKIHDKI